MRKYCAVFGLLIVLGSVLSGQTPYFRNLGVGQGLPSNYVYNVFQDNDGYLWFGTNAGAVRYDGYRFRYFNVMDGLTSNDIFGFFQDSQDRIWFRTHGGKPCYYYQDSIFNGHNDSQLKGLVFGPFIIDIVEDEQGAVYFAGYRGSIARLERNGQVETDSNHTNIYALQVLESGDVCLIDNRGYHRFDEIGELDSILVLKTRTHIDKVGKEVFVSRNLKPGEMELSLWYNQDSIHAIHTFPGKENAIIFVYRRPGGQLWVCTRKGVFAESEPYSYRFFKLFQDETISNVFEDREGVLWVSTFESGVYFTPSPGLNVFGENEGILGNKVLSLANENDEKLWFGGIRNLYGYLQDGKIQTEILPGFAPLEIPRVRIMSDKSIWIIGKAGFAKITEKETKYLWIWGNDIILNDDGDYLESTHEILHLTKSFVKSRLTFESEPLLDMTEFKRGLIKKGAKVFCKGKDGVIWAGSNLGLIKIRDNKLESAQFDHPGLKAPVHDIHYLPENDMLLVATIGNGLIVRLSDGTWKGLGPSEGLVNPLITCLKPVSPDSVWIGTNRGIFLANLAGDTFKCLDAGSAIGLGEIKVNDVETFQGQVYLATDEGLAFFDPKEKGHLAQPPLIYLDEVRVNGIPLPDSNHRFNHNQSSITISYMGISTRGGDLDYRYRLAGFDTEWQKTSSREVNFRALAPGEYTFEVQAFNSLGNASEKTASFQFEILTPYWQKNWFLVTGILFILMVTVLGWRIRLSFLKSRFELEKAAAESEKKKLEIERNLFDLEQQALRMQMNPHFIFNALNTIKGYYAESREIEASGYISKFARLLRLILESNDKLIPLEKEINILKLYLELAQVRYDNKFDFEIKVGKGISKDETAIPPMLLQPLVENSIIHGIGPKKGKGKLEVGFEIQGESLLCWVEDDGIGRIRANRRENKSKSLSHSTQVVKERLSLIREQSGKASAISYIDLVDPYGIPLGTRAEVKIPYQAIW